jgi:hypothetical protein
VRQNVTVQIRDQQVLIRQGGRIGVPTISGPTSRPGNGGVPLVARHTRQAANQRCRQVIAGHWAGLVPQRSIEAAQAGNGAGAGVVELESVRRSSLARPLSDYAAVVAEVG